MLFVKTFLCWLFGIGLLASTLFIPAEIWYWFDAIIFLIVSAVLWLLGCMYLCSFHPANIEARLMFPYASNQPIEDKFATALLGITFFLSLIFIPLDVFHSQIFMSPSFPVKCLGLTVHVFGFLLFILTCIQNEFAQPIVNLQKERGQVLIDSGLYAYVRHPMYFGLIFCLYPGMALWLGSIFMATFGTMIIFLTFMPRILIEEKTLRRDLAGYDDYTNRVTSMIIPMVF